MRNVVIPAFVLLPSLAGIVHAARDARSWGYAPLQEQRELIAREESVTYSAEPSPRT